MSEIVNKMRAKGYRSSTACKVIANRIVNQKDTTPEQVNASIDTLLKASPEEKEKHEKAAKEYKETMDKERKKKKEGQ